MPQVLHPDKPVPECPHEKQVIADRTGCHICILRCHVSGGTAPIRTYKTTGRLHRPVCPFWLHFCQGFLQKHFRLKARYWSASRVFTSCLPARRRKHTTRLSYCAGRLIRDAANTGKIESLEGRKDRSQLVLQSRQLIES